MTKEDAISILDCMESDMIEAYVGMSRFDPMDDVIRQRIEAIKFCQDVLRTQQEAEKCPGEISDGYHTFNELYHHRAVLFGVICNQHPEQAWKSKKHNDGTMYDGMFIVGINTPNGQATYHYDIDPYWDMFHVAEVEYAPEWDGHTPEEAIRRISTLANAEKNKPLTVIYTAHEVAALLAEVIGDDCACNVNSNDEWLPLKCDFTHTVCPNTVGVACWEQWLKHRTSLKEVIDNA